MKDLYL